MEGIARLPLPAGPRTRKLCRPPDGRRLRGHARSDDSGAFGVDAGARRRRGWCGARRAGAIDWQETKGGPDVKFLIPITYLIGPLALCVLLASARVGAALAAGRRRLARLEPSAQSRIAL